MLGAEELTHAFARRLFRFLRLGSRHGRWSSGGRCRRRGSWLARGGTCRSRSRRRNAAGLNNRFNSHCRCRNSRLRDRFGLHCGRRLRLNRRRRLADCGSGLGLNRRRRFAGCGSRLGLNRRRWLAGCGSRLGLNRRRGLAGYWSRGILCTLRGSFRLLPAGLRRCIVLIIGTIGENPPHKIVLVPSSICTADKTMLAKIRHHRAGHHENGCNGNKRPA